MTKVPRNPRRQARRPRGAAPAAAGVLALLALALSAPARAGELTELPDPQPSGGALAGVEAELGGVTAPQLSGEAEAPGSVAPQAEAPAVEQLVSKMPEAPPPEVEPPPDVVAPPPELPESVSVVPDPPSRSFANVNVRIRILSPGDDGDVIQLNGGPSAPSRPVADVLACGGCFSHSLDPLPSATPPSVLPEPQPELQPELLADAPLPALTVHVGDAPRAPEGGRAQPPPSPAPDRASPAPAPSFAAVAATPLPDAPVAPRGPQTARPERASPERRVRAERATGGGQELPLAGAAASTAPPGGSGPSLLLVVLLGVLSLLAPRAAEPAWMRSRRLRSLIASERLERPG